MSDHICPKCHSSNTEEDPVVVSSSSIYGATPIDLDPFSIMVDLASTAANVVRKGYETVSGKKRYYCNNCKKNFYVDDDE